MIKNSLNPEGHQNPISRLKVKAILPKRWILPIGGALSGRVCACSLSSRLVCSTVVTSSVQFIFLAVFYCRVQLVRTSCPWTRCASSVRSPKHILLAKPTSPHIPSSTSCPTALLPSCPPALFTSCPPAPSPPLYLSYPPR